MATAPRKSTSRCAHPSRQGLELRPLRGVVGPEGVGCHNGCLAASRNTLRDQPSEGCQAEDSARNAQCGRTVGSLTGHLSFLYNGDRQPEILHFHVNTRSPLPLPSSPGIADEGKCRRESFLDQRAKMLE